MKMNKFQVEQGLERLLRQKEGIPFEEPFPHTSRPFTELCQDWLEMHAEIDRLQALVPKWRPTEQGPKNGESK